MSRFDSDCILASASMHDRLAELARLTQLLAVRGLANVPLIELHRLLQLEGVKLGALDLSKERQAELPWLSRLVYGEICRRFDVV